jgi:hypothetical protein
MGLAPVTSAVFLIDILVKRGQFGDASGIPQAELIRITNTITT